jgi:hypothetical protein
MWRLNTPCHHSPCYHRQRLWHPRKKGECGPGFSGNPDAAKDILFPDEKVLKE